MRIHTHLQQTTTTLSITIPLLSLLLFFLLGTSSVVTACNSVFPSNLDVGFFVLMNRPGEANRSYWQKSCADPSNPDSEPYLLTPNAPTVIFIHGLQDGYVEAGQQFGDFHEVSEVFALLQLKIVNIVMFRWTQIADDKVENFERVESFIHSTNSFHGIQFQYQDPNDKNHKVKWADLSGAMRMSVADRFAVEYFKHINTVFGWDPELRGRTYEVRVIGHSLGTQVAVAGAFRIAYPGNFTALASYATADRAIGISRITLLDPIFSRGNRKYFHKSNPYGDDVMNVLSSYIDILLRDKGTPTEDFKSSHLSNCEGIAPSNHPITRSVAYARVKMREWGHVKPGNCFSMRMLSGNPISNYRDFALQSLMTHIYIIYYYFAAVVYPPHQCIISADRKHCAAQEALSLGPLMDTATVRYYASEEFEEIGKACFIQFGEPGGDHFQTLLDHTPKNDLFYLKSCDGVNF